MGAYLTLDKGGNASSCDVISQKMMNEAAESGKRIFQKGPDGRYFEMRVALEPNVDPRAGKSYTIDNWVPVAGLPSELEEEARKSNEQDSNVRLRDPGDRSIPEGLQRMAHNLGTKENIDITDPNFRNSAAAKDLAQQQAAGNLALRDPVGARHDGQPAPADKMQPNQSVAGRPPAQAHNDEVEAREKQEAANKPSTQAGQPSVGMQNLGQPPSSQQQKPASPPPDVTPPATPKK